MRLSHATLALLAPLAAASASHLPRAPAGEPKISYDGYHVYSIRASSALQYRELETRLAGYHTVHSRDGVLEVAIPPHEVRHFTELGLDARLLSDDLGAQIRAESASGTAIYDRAVHKRDGELPDLSWYDSYHAYADHLQYWDDLADAFAGHVEKFELGHSYEGRSISAYRYWGSNKAPVGDKPIILWHSTVHAREWITTLVLEYWAYQLIAGWHAGDANATFFLDYYDFWLVPFHNPDGFVYTQTTDRMWRKNRQPRPGVNASCIGTDLNRNWKYKWGSNPGASPDPCSDTFQGRCAGDTPENRALSQLSDKLGGTAAGIRSYIDLHSYGNKILTPYGWTCDPTLYPATLPRQLEVAGGVAATVKASSGAVYTYGPGCDIEYYSSGNGRDHHYGAYGANHAWTLELEPITAAEGGFVLPPERIWPVVEEQWDGQLWLLHNVTQDVRLTEW